MTDHTRALLEQALDELLPISHNSTDDPRGQADKAIALIRSELAKPVKASQTASQLAATVLADCGISTDCTALLMVVAARIAQHEVEMIDNLKKLAKPVEQDAQITLDQFRAIANRTATTYRHRSDPEKSSYAFVDGSSLDDFWRKVCEAIQPTSAWNDAPEVAALKAKRDAQLAIYDEVIDNLQSQVDELVAALKGVIRVADRKTDEFDAARAAIAKAEGEST